MFRVDWSVILAKAETHISWQASSASSLLPSMLVASAIAEGRKASTNCPAASDEHAAGFTLISLSFLVPSPHIKNADAPIIVYVETALQGL